MPITISGSVRLGNVTGGPSATNLSDLHDVSIITPLTGHHLRFNQISGEWENAYLNQDVYNYLDAAFTVTNGLILTKAAGPQTINIGMANILPVIGTYGNSTEIPVITVDATGRITGISTTPAASSGSGGGTVTSISVIPANGISGSILNPTTTPALTLSLGAITPLSVLATGTVYGTNLTGTNTGDQIITLTGDITGTGTNTFATTLSNTTVTPGIYLRANITVDAKGRITSASNGAVGPPGSPFAEDIIVHSLTVGSGTISTTPFPIDSNERIGVSYIIASVGTTDFTLIGSGNNIVGQLFIATTNLTATGTGTVTFANFMNTAIGYQTLSSNDFGWQDTAIGINALYQNVNGTNNTAIGSNTLELADANYNTAIGSHALSILRLGDLNTAIGYHAQFVNDSGTGTTSVGANTFSTLLSGLQNTAIGYGAGSAITTGNYNVVIGGSTGSTINTLNNHIIISDGLGTERIQINDTGVCNIVGSLTVNGLPPIGTPFPTDIVVNGITIGQGPAPTNSNTVVGHLAFLSNISGFSNTSIGLNTLAADTTGYLDTAVGASALINNTIGHDNVAIGANSLFTNIGGNFNIALGNNTLYLSTGDDNTAIGANTLSDITTGIGNTAVGSNTGLGITTGNYNSIIGAGVAGLAAGLSNNIIIADGQGNQRINVDATGNVGIGQTVPTAVLHLKAGTIAANTAPIKLTSGPLLTIPEPGSKEFLTDDYYGTTTTGPIRKTFAWIPSQSDVTGTRALNTSYTAPATRSIMITATVRCAVTTASGHAYVQGKSDALAVPTTIASGIVGIETGLLNDDKSFQISFVVAPGMKYRIDSSTATGSVTLGNWFETAF